MSKKNNAGEKKLFAASAAYILGLGPVQTIRGTPVQVEAYKKTIAASRNLYEALEISEDSSAVLALIEEKNKKARDLYNKTGIRWPFQFTTASDLTP